MTPAQQELARWVLRRERELGKEPDAPVVVAERALRALAPGVTALVTAAGYRALLGRALLLARAEFPALDAMRIAASGGYISGRHLPRSGAADDSLVALIGTLIALLATFIGDDLTDNLIRNARPDASPQRTAAGSGGTR